MRCKLASCEDFYLPPQPNIWQGRDDGEKLRIFQHIKCIDRNQLENKNTFEDGSLIFCGFCCDEGVKRNHGRVGAKEAPEVLKEQLAKLPWHTSQKNLSLFDIGNIVCVEDRLEEAQLALSQLIKTVQAKNGVTVVFGGGHETAWGHYLGIHKKWGSSNLAIVNLDAHFDLRPMLKDNQGTSGTAFTQIEQLRRQVGLAFNYYCLGIQKVANTQRLFDKAHDLKVLYMQLEQMQQEPKSVEAFINNILTLHDKIYLTICLDAFSQAFAPGVSAPNANGLTPIDTFPIIQRFAQSGKVVAMDIVEYAPKYDQQMQTARLASSCVANFLYSYQSESPL